MSMMQQFAANPALLLGLTIAVYWFVTHLRQRTGNILFNPVVLSTLAVMGYLFATGTSYRAYHQAAQYIDFWLQPAVVCLAVPLYRQWPTIRRQWLPILASQLVGSITGIVSVVWIARMMGASHEVVVSLSAKSVTSPVAIEIVNSVGGLPALTTASVIFAGMIGQMVGFRVLRWSRVRMPSSRGIGVGTGSHAMGLSSALEQSRKVAAFASLGLILNGVVTACLVPLILPLMGY